MKRKSLEKKTELADLENSLKVARGKRRKLVYIISNHIDISQKLCSTIGSSAVHQFFFFIM